MPSSRTHIQRELAADWAELLGVEDPRPEDDFFELGGHSLNAVRVVARIEQRYRVELPLNTIFAYPTIADLAAVVALAVEAGASTLTDEDVDALLRH